MIRRNYKYVKRFRTSLQVNKSVKGDSIELMIERIKAGEGVDGIEDRDLVYNDNETNGVNPLTNIRTDKMEAMVDEKIGEYEHKHRKLKVVKDEPAEDENGEERAEK